MPNMRIDERRELLLQAGERVIARTGMQGATTRAVVAEAGMPLASFHYAFASRRDFIRQLIERRMVPHDVPSPSAARTRRRWPRTWPPSRRLTWSAGLSRWPWPSTGSRTRSCDRYCGSAGICSTPAWPPISRPSPRVTRGSG
ncbi:TetR family transcriptional regulator [Raineyella fluvialis]|uniref:TetR family transcriptional regulator n=1 Tax=Raineyella fluvialis TaxID=2662261 RepID=A0A5Q2FF07_9ACTN|nr:TetR family transcriptional regulator [Raineyella fluvialis]